MTEKYRIIGYEEKSTVKYREIYGGEVVVSRREESLFKVDSILFPGVRLIVKADTVGDSTDHEIVQILSPNWRVEKKLGGPNEGRYVITNGKNQIDAGWFDAADDMPAVYLSNEQINAAYKKFIPQRCGVTE